MHLKRIVQNYIGFFFLLLVLFMSQPQSVAHVRNSEIKQLSTLFFAIHSCHSDTSSFTYIVLVFHLLSVDLKFLEIGLDLWCLTPLSTVFQLYRNVQSLLLVEETGGPGENHQQVTEKLYCIMLYRVYLT